MAYLQRADCQLYYEVHGAGIPFLMLHGNGEDGSYFQHQINAFADRFQVITMDMRGHGQSQHGTTPLDFVLFAEDVIALLDTLGIERCILMGFSDGGNTALTLAARYPDRFHVVIANGANHHPSGIKRMVQWPIILGYWCCSLFVIFSKKARQNQEILNLMVHHPNLKKEQLAQIKLPVLIICGTKDIVKQEESELLHEWIPTSTLVMVEGNHFIAAKQPAAFNNQIKVFLRAYHLFDGK